VDSAAQRDKLEQVATVFLARANRIVAAAQADEDPSNDELAGRSADDGRADFHALIIEAGQLPTQELRNERLGRFATSCAAQIESQG
jgi:hypothetical protein